MNILEQIVIQKKNHNQYLIQKIKNNRISNINPKFTYSIKNEIKKGKNALIAEFKRFSPSINKFKNVKNLQEIISEYNLSNCCAISILTDKNFGGSLNDLLIAKKITSKPIIRKDFIVDKSQILESKIYKADAILLIAKVLTKKKITELYNYAKKINLDVLIEVENEIEIEKIKHIKAELVGINNRNLKKQKIDVNKSINLSKILKDKIIICESGVTDKNIRKIKSQSNINSFLIGGSILNNKNRIGFINKLYQS